jgi:hypothetical protein
LWALGRAGADRGADVPQVGAGAVITDEIVAAVLVECAWVPGGNTASASADAIEVYTGTVVANEIVAAILVALAGVPGRTAFVLLVVIVFVLG